MFQWTLLIWCLCFFALKLIKVHLWISQLIWTINSIFLHKILIYFVGGRCFVVVVVVAAIIVEVVSSFMLKFSLFSFTIKSIMSKWKRYVNYSILKIILPFSRFCRDEMKWISLKSFKREKVENLFEQKKEEISEMKLFEWKNTNFTSNINSLSDNIPVNSEVTKSRILWTISDADITFLQTYFLWS